MPDFERDRWGRPLVVPAAGGKPKPYARVSSFGQILENQFGLNKWKQRMVLLGAIDRPDLMQLATAAKSDDRKLDGLVEQMLDAGGASRAANTGTAIHDVLAQVDAGDLTLDAVPDQFLAQARAWQDLLDAHGLQPVPDMVELQVVNDRFEAAGSADNICRTADGRLVLVDKKTGKKIGQRPLAYMVQLAIYATSDRYDVETGKREPLGVDDTVAYIAHVPASGGEAVLYEIDVAEGLRLAELAADAKRAEKQATPIRKMEPAAAPAAEPGSPAKRLWVADRLSTILEYPKAKTLLGSRWPADLPRLSSDHRHSDAELEQIAAIVQSIEDEVSAPFPPADPTAEKPAPRKKAAAKTEPPATIDEGGRADDQAVEALQRTLSNLRHEHREFVMRWAKEAHESGRSLSLRQNQSIRRFEAARLLIELATRWESDEAAMAVLADCGETNDTVGTTVAWYSVDQSKTAMERSQILAQQGRLQVSNTGDLLFQTPERPDTNG